MNLRHATIGQTSALLAALFAAVAGLAAAEETTESAPIAIFDGKPKLLVVNGYSTSFRWPAMLQRKLDRYFDGDSPVRVESAVRPGTPIARWIDVETGEPKGPWGDIVQPALANAKDQPVVVLAQQSLQWVFGGQAEGIRGPDDGERISRGADALEKYARLLQADGADLVIIAVHIYKRPMEPAIENEKYALERLIKRDISNVERGPDVWTKTKALYPKAFAADLMHPNTMGAEVMAQLWFETVLEREGLDTPAWSREEMQMAVDQP